MLRARRGLSAFTVYRREPLGRMHGLQLIDHAAQSSRQRLVGQLLIRERSIATDLGRLVRVEHRQFRRRDVVRHVRVPVLIDVARLALIAQLNDVGMFAQPGVRMPHQRPPSPREGHLLFRGQVLLRKRKHVMPQEQRVQFAPSRVVNAANIKAFDPRTKRRGETAYRQRSHLPTPVNPVPSSLPRSSHPA